MQLFLVMMLTSCLLNLVMVIVGAIRDESSDIYLKIMFGWIGVNGVAAISMAVVACIKLWIDLL